MGSTNQGMDKRLEEKPVEWHEDLYRMFFSALVINEEGGHTESSEFTRRQIGWLLAYGKVSQGSKLAIEAQVYRVHAKAKQILEEIIRETPDTSHSTIRH